MADLHIEHGEEMETGLYSRPKIVFLYPRMPKTGHFGCKTAILLNSTKIQETGLTAPESG